MPLKLEYKSKILNFKLPAGTSRGVLTQKRIWILKVYLSDMSSENGLGEVAPLEKLSIDWEIDMEVELRLLSENLALNKLPKSEKEVYDLVEAMIPNKFPSLRFGLETALLDLLHGGKREIFQNDFYNNEQPIPINGLVWMGDKSFMKKQIDDKIKAGFKCIKIKIGALDFELELDLLKYIRTSYSSDKLTIRVDANGAFSTQKALLKLKQLEAFDLHSIEQPIMARQIMSMQLLCVKSKVPIALDEELIGIFGTDAKSKLLDDINPQYIILKPTLLGGFRETAEWIELAEQRNIGWWITSALESNIGLNAICQFTANYSINSHQGLGTGMLYEDNIDSPLMIIGESIVHKQNKGWDDL